MRQNNAKSILTSFILTKYTQELLECSANDTEQRIDELFNSSDYNMLIRYGKQKKIILGTYRKKNTTANRETRTG